MPLRLPWLTLILIATHCLLFSESYQARIAQAYGPIGKTYFHFGNLFGIKRESTSAAHALWKLRQSQLRGRQSYLTHYLLISSAISLLFEEQLRLLFDTEIKINWCDQFFDNLIVRGYFPSDAREDLVCLYRPSLSFAVLIHRFFSTCRNAAEHGYCENMCFNSALET